MVNLPGLGGTRSGLAGTRSGLPGTRSGLPGIFSGAVLISKEETESTVITRRFICQLTAPKFTSNKVLEHGKKISNTKPCTPRGS